MAKKAMKIKQARPQKYKTREYNRCKLCGRPHAYIRKYGIIKVDSQYASVRPEWRNWQTR